MNLEKCGVYVPTESMRFTHDELLQPDERVVLIGVYQDTVCDHDNFRDHVMGGVTDAVYNHLRYDSPGVPARNPGVTREFLSEFYNGLVGPCEINPGKDSIVEHAERRRCQYCKRGREKLLEARSGA